jgi:Ca2+-binding RTX toxin-like protein
MASVWPVFGSRVGMTMELLFILPWLLGLGAVSMFTSGGDSSGTVDDGGGITTNPNNRVVTGTDAGEQRNGDTGDDFVLGGGGNDTIYGNAADDLLLGEGGSDAIYGGVGYDTLLGGWGNDTIDGGTGKDFIIGGAGHDSVLGAAGDDTISGSSGQDTLSGGGGNDVISGLDIGNDLLNAQAFNFIGTPVEANLEINALAKYAVDTYGTTFVGDLQARLNENLTSGNNDVADDLLYGGAGNDYIFADYSDTITGGAGADRIEIFSDGANEAVTVTDLVIAEDVLRINVASGTNPAVSFVNGATPEIGVSVVIAGDVVAVLQGLTAASIPAGFIQVVVGNGGGGPIPIDPNNLVITGTSANDARDGGTGDDLILGNSGNDTIFGNGADDLLLGEAGADSIVGDQGYDTILGGAGNDTIDGGVGLDLLIGGAGDDSILGGEGNDTISGSSGRDTLNGGSGNDLISGVDVGPKLDALAINLIDSSSNAASRDLDLANYAVDTYGNVVIGDYLARIGAGLRSADTDTSDDILLGGAGNDIILADYSDTITGGAGADSFVVFSDGANEAVTVTDLVVAEDVLRIVVASGTNPAVSFVNGATPAIGVSVVIAGDVVAVLQGLTAANIPANFVQVTVSTT